MRHFRLHSGLIILAGCFGAAALSSDALFYTGGSLGPSWIDCVFVVAIFVGVTVGVRMMVRGATLTVQRYVDGCPDRSRD